MGKHRIFLKNKADQKKLLLAGRFADKSGSLVVWNVSSTKEARDLAMEDPYFENGNTSFILKEWGMTWNFLTVPPVQPKL